MRQRRWVLPTQVARHGEYHHLRGTSGIHGFIGDNKDHTFFEDMVALFQKSHHPDALQGIAAK
jgi:hypothetical protein